jgi:hypothetical protein
MDSRRKKENKGFGERLALIAESKLVQMMGKLHLDLFCQEKYLLNQVEMKIKLRRSRDVFALTGVTDTFKIKDISLFVRKVQLSPNIRMGHVKALEKTSSKYPIRRVEVKVDTVPRGNTNYVQDNMFLGQMPKRLVIGCVDSDALNGIITKNPFNFKNYKINFLALNVDGNRFPANLYNQILATTDTSGITWGCIPVPERCSRTKEIPFPGNITENATPCLGLT